MKILYFTPFYPPQGEAAATRAYWFVKVLKEAGHTVSVLNASEFQLRPASNKARAFVRLLKENLTGIELFLKILTSRSDVIILSSPPFFTVIWGVWGSILTGQKFILDIRDLYPEIFFELGMIRENSFFGSLAKKVTGIAYRKAYAIMTVTQGLCREIEKYGEKKPLLVMNGFDPELFYPGPFEDKFERFTLVFHGTIGKVQNVDTLLKVARRLEPYSINILVAGEGPKLQIILDAKISNITYLGNISIQGIAAILRRCHVGISFRTDDKIGKEAFPVKVFEYIGSGIPIVMTPISEAGEIITAENLGYQFKNSDVDLIVEKIIDLKRNWGPTLVRHQRFSRREQAKEILKFIK